MYLPTLECNSVVYRAVLRAGHIDDNGQILGDAFHRRRGTDDAGVSVCIELPPGECFRQLGWKAVVSFHVGFARDLGLRLDVDEPHHAHVVGLPYEANEHDLESLRRANLLARHARYVIQPKQSRARAIWDRFESEFSSEPTWVAVSADAKFWHARMADGSLRQLPVLNPSL